MPPQDQRFAFVASARMQLKLHGVHETIFPKPLPMPLPPELSSHGALPAGLPPSAVAADMLCKLVFRPLPLAGVVFPIGGAPIPPMDGRPPPAPPGGAFP